ncbi:MAG: 4Fe-4S binding protein [Candidatus Bathyarchaeia archaeon]
MAQTESFPQFPVATKIGARPRGGWRVHRPVVDEALCSMCWLCVDYCPDGHMMKGEDGPVVHLRFCKGCGICANECPSEAIEMVEEHKLEEG